MRTSRLAVPLLAAAALAACANREPPTFHTLMAPAEAARPATAPTPLDFRIDPVRVPPQVDVPQWVVRTPNGDLQVLEQQRWVAALADEWRDAVGDQLARRLGSLDLTHVRSSAPAYRVQLDVLRFDTAPGSEVVQQLAWTLRSPTGSAPALTCHTEMHEAAPADYAGTAQAHRRALARVAAQIADAVKAVSAGRTASCPG
jgi:uncharacterized lipoprotein YmbA